MKERALYLVERTLNSMNFQEIKSAEDRFQLETYKKMGIAVESGKGSYIWTEDGTKYLDLYGGHAVCGTGHSHPKVVAAICEQAGKVLFYSNLVYSGVRAKAAEKLVSISPDTLSRAFFCNSGTEANENAMRIARMATGRSKIISFNGGFHGRTADSISATFLGRYREIGEPNVPDHVAADFGDIESVRSLAGSDTAAIILEPIQSMAGIKEASPQFFVDLRNLCDRLGIVLIFDEVQTGIGRTGHWFFSASPFAGGIQPDIITLAKSLGSGIPVGACLVNEAVSDPIRANDLGTTFGGGMIAMAAVLATLETIEEENMLANAVRVEQAFRSAIAGHQIHGKGCLLGIRFDEGAADAHAELLSQRIITGTSSDPQVLRLLPPLNLGSDDVDLSITALNRL